MEAHKIKLIIVGALAVSVVTIGVFQFTGGGGQQPAPKKKSMAKKDDAAPSIVTSADPNNPSSKINQVVAENRISEDNPAALVYREPLEQRDPFNQGSAKLEIEKDPLVGKPPVTTSGGAAQTRPSGDTWKPKGQPIQPLDPGASFPVMPSAGGSGNTDIRPIKDPNAFSMTPIGVIMGAHPAAVFLDDSGNQRLVSLGGSLGDKSTVIGIEKNKVRVRHNDKVLTFNVGGTPNEK